MNASPHTHQRYAMGIEYDGTAYQGWQQLGQHGPSVQASLQHALSRVANTPVSIVCAGRTDARVHAQCQVIHFETDVMRTLHAWTFGTNANLTQDITVRWCVPVAADFDARKSAYARRYRYRILNRTVRPALRRKELAWERRTLDAQAMHQAAQALVGEHDFSAFRSAQCQALHARRCLHSISIQRHSDIVECNVQANAFLHHMVRNIIGSLQLVGTKEQPTQWIAELLACQDRKKAGPTAAPQGLVFIGPLYPPRWELPSEVTI